MIGELRLYPVALLAALLPIESKPPSKLRWNEDLVAVRDIVHAVFDEEEAEEKQTSVEENPERIVKPILRLVNIQKKNLICSDKYGMHRWIFFKIIFCLKAKLSDFL